MRGGLLWWCFLYYSAAPHSDLVGGAVRKTCYVATRSFEPVGPVGRLSDEGRAPEKGAATEARPLRGYARAADFERAITAGALIQATRVACR